MTERTVLARAAINGEYTVFLADPVPDVCWLRFAPGTPHWTEVRVYECSGAGPYEAWLGADANTRTRLSVVYPIGTVVEVFDA